MLTLFLLPFFSVIIFYCGMRHERYRARKKREAAQLKLLEVYFGFTLKAGESVEELTERTKTYIRDPFKEARENPIGYKRNLER